MLPRSQRLTSAQFDRAFAHSQSVRHPLIALKAHRRGDDSTEIRAAFVVPKKQAHATGRNRTRRRTRERYRLMERPESLAGCDLIFLTTPATHDASNDEIDAALREVMRRMGRKLNSEAAGLTSSSNRVIGAPSELQESGTSATELGTEPLPRLEEGASLADIQPTARAAAPARLALALIGFYQRFISPGLPPSCRFYPSCSRYTYGAIERFGLLRGLLLGAHRVCRCHPWHPGGLEPVPASLPPLRQSGANGLAKLKSQVKSQLARRGFASKSH